MYLTLSQASQDNDWGPVKEILRTGGYMDEEDWENFWYFVRESNDSEVIRLGMGINPPSMNYLLGSELDNMTTYINTCYGINFSEFLEHVDHSKRIDCQLIMHLVELGHECHNHVLVMPDLPPEYVRFFLDRGVDPNVERGWETALSCAAKSGPIENVRMLLEAGADLHVDNLVWKTIISGQDEILNLLVEHGLLVDDTITPTMESSLANIDKCRMLKIILTHTTEISTDELESLVDNEYLDPDTDVWIETYECLNNYPTDSMKMAVFNLNWALILAICKKNVNLWECVDRRDKPIWKHIPQNILRRIVKIQKYHIPPELLTRYPQLAKEITHQQHVVNTLLLTRFFQQAPTTETSCLSPEDQQYYGVYDRLSKMSDNLIKQVCLF